MAETATIAGPIGTVGDPKSAEEGGLLEGARVWVSKDT
jgi:hypothetical protein